MQESDISLQHYHSSPVIYNIGLPITWALQSLAKLLIITSLSFANPLNSIYTLISSHTHLKVSELIKAAASMASQTNNATFFRSSAKDSDKITLLSPNGRCSHLPSKASGAKKRSVEQSKARKRSMVCLRGLASSALYLMKKARQFQKWHVSDEYVNAAEGVEPYFSIPVVA